MSERERERARENERERVRERKKDCKFVYIDVLVCLFTSLVYVRVCVFECM